MSGIWVLRSFEALEPSRESWDRLAGLGGCAEPFMHWEWVRVCATQGPYRLEPYVLVDMEGDVVRAIGPFGRLGKVPGRRRIMWLGRGPSDYQAVLSDGASEGERRVWAALLERTDWDWIELDPLAQPEAETLQRMLEPGKMSASYQPKGLCPVLDLRQEARASAVKAAQYEWRRLARGGRLEVRKAEEPEALDALLAGLFDLHQRRWSGPTPSRFADAAVRRWFAALSRAWSRAGCLDARGLYLEDRLIAAHLGACTRERFYYHTPAFDPAFAKHSPGNILIWKLIEDCRARGVRWFDFLRGDEQYKHIWGADAGTPYGRLRIVRNRLGLRGLPETFDRLGSALAKTPGARAAARTIKDLLGE